MTSTTPILRSPPPSHQRAAGLFSALGSPIRTRLLLALLDGSTSTRELAQSLGVSDAAVSQHLTVLRHHGIVHSRRSGKTVLHTIVDERAIRVLRLAMHEREEATCCHAPPAPP
jgi:DNA-binding transcriptional ArsR family regulator